MATTTMNAAEFGRRLAKTDIDACAKAETAMDDTWGAEHTDALTDAIASGEVSGRLEETVSGHDIASSEDRAMASWAYAQRAAAE